MSKINMMCVYLEVVHGNIQGFILKKRHILFVINCFMKNGDNITSCYEVNCR